MSNKEWVALIAKEFNVSNTMAKGMLHAMYKAKDILSVSRDVRKAKAEAEKKLDKELEEYAWMDWCDNQVL